jgi:hypothetical protein
MSGREIEQTKMECEAGMDHMNANETVAEVDRLSREMLAELRAGEAATHDKRTGGPAMASHAGVWRSVLRADGGTRTGEHGG